MTTQARAAAYLGIAPDDILELAVRDNGDVVVINQAMQKFVISAASLPVEPQAAKQPPMVEPAKARRPRSGL